MIIYATSRSGSDTGIEVAHPNSVRYSQLDITVSSSIFSLFEEIQREHGAADVLVNNAAVVASGETPETCERNMWTNYGGTKAMCEAFLRQFHRRAGARIVNVTSGLNALSTYGAQVQEAFRTVSDISQLDTLAQNFLDIQKSGGPNALTRAGWGLKSSYVASKGLINLLTIYLSRSHPTVLINCCCPGWANTDIGRLAQGEPPKTPEEGARTAVRCAIGDLGPAGNADGGLGREGEKLSGMFYENDNIAVPGWGKPKDWMHT
jgi:carbonyl reductase 1